MNPSLRVAEISRKLARLSCVWMLVFLASPAFCQKLSAPAPTGPTVQGSTKNPDGSTTTVYRNPDGTQTTVTSKNGKTIPNPTPPPPPLTTPPPAPAGPTVQGSTKNPDGSTTTVYRNPDGTQTTVTTKNGNVIPNPTPPTAPTLPTLSLPAPGAQNLTIATCSTDDDCAKTKAAYDKAFKDAMSAATALSNAISNQDPNASPSALTSYLTPFQDAFNPAADKATAAWDNYQNCLKACAKTQAPEAAETAKTSVPATARGNGLRYGIKTESSPVFTGGIRTTISGPETKTVSDTKQTTDLSGRKYKHTVTTGTYTLPPASEFGQPLIIVYKDETVTWLGPFGLQVIVYEHVLEVGYKLDGTPAGKQETIYDDYYGTETINYTSVVGNGKLEESWETWDDDGDLFDWGDPDIVDGSIPPQDEMMNTFETPNGGFTPLPGDLQQPLPYDLRSDFHRNPAQPLAPCNPGPFSGESLGPTFVVPEFGASCGGPIKKAKFFTLQFEGMDSTIPESLQPLPGLDLDGTSGGKQFSIPGDVIDDTVFFWHVPTGATSLAIRNTQFASSSGNSYKLSPKLSLNIGWRYESSSGSFSKALGISPDSLAGGAKEFKIKLPPDCKHIITGGQLPSDVNQQLFRCLDDDSKSGKHPTISYTGTVVFLGDDLRGIFSNRVAAGGYNIASGLALNLLLRGTNTAALSTSLDTSGQDIASSGPTAGSPAAGPTGITRVAPRDSNSRVASTTPRSGGRMQLVSLRARDPLLAFSPRGPMGLPAEEDPQAGAFGKIIYSLVSNGNPSGQALELQVFDPSGAVQEKDMELPEGVVLEPVKPGSAKPVAEMEKGNNVLTKALVAYCVDYAKLAPEAGMLFRIAPQAVQDRYGSIRFVLQAGRELAAAGKFHPDSKPEAYMDSIRQYALWAKIENWDQEKFGEVFLEKTRENSTAAKVKWTKELERYVAGLVPGRWRDISMVLDEAARLSKDQETQGPR
jgi:hypothetical protein